MTTMELGAAIDRAVAQAMERDERVVVFGEDVPLMRPALFARFGGDRIRAAPISESAFLGAAAGAAMGGLRPIVEIMLVDFLAVGFSAVLNEMAKVEAFSGGRWSCPLVVRTTCGGGYGDGGQHEQALWGLLGGIPGLTVVVPSTPADAAGLMRAAIEDDGPVVFLEHKLLSRLWLDAMGGSGRDTVAFDVPADGAEGPVEIPIAPVPLGRSVVRRQGDELTIVSLGVGVHRALEAAGQLAASGVEAEVIDLRGTRPLDVEAVVESVGRTGALLVVDEDYRECGLSGELAAICAEAGLRFGFRRVATETVIPYARRLEREALPGVERILRAAAELRGSPV
jgi:pyruvate/2-oxoglutarate/acetoin dehydrogenase E1 component